MFLKVYGPNQCILNFPENFANLFSYNNTRPPSLIIFFLMCLSCQDFSLAFCTYRWNPTMNMYSSKASIWDILSFIMLGPSIFVTAAILRLGIMYSISITVSSPYTNLKSVFPVSYLHVILYALNATRILKSQSSLFTLRTFINAFSIILLKYSTIPFA